MKKRLLELLYALIALVIVVIIMQIWAYFVTMGLICHMHNVPITDPFWLFTNCWFIFTR